jgi:beta-lactamase class A
MLTYMKNQKFRWGLAKGVPRRVEVADKTGNLDNICNDVGIVFSPAGDYVLAVFTHGFTNKNNAKKLIKQVSKTVYATYLSADAH